MPTSICLKCEKVFHWRNQRGIRKPECCEAKTVRAVYDWESKQYLPAPPQAVQASEEKAHTEYCVLCGAKIRIPGPRSQRLLQETVFHVSRGLFEPIETRTIKADSVICRIHNPEFPVYTGWMSKPMSTVYFAFAVADSMLPAGHTFRKDTLALAEVSEALDQEDHEVISAVNPSHKPTIEAMKSRFDLNIEVPEKAPLVSLKKGDVLIVASVRGLPRLEGRHEYTAEEIEKATFVFSMYTVL